MRRRRPVLPHPFDPTLAIVTLSRGYSSIISIEDAAAVGENNWSALICRKMIYAQRDFKNKPYLLHRLIAERAGIHIPAGHEIDHVDGNGLNNARFNLRAATREQNMHNAPLQSDNRSGVKGVSLHACGRWQATIRAHGKQHYLGLFATVEEAAVVVEAMRDRLHGQFANHGRN